MEVSTIILAIVIVLVYLFDFFILKKLKKNLDDTRAEMDELYEKAIEAQNKVLNRPVKIFLHQDSEEAEMIRVYNQLMSDPMSVVGSMNYDEFTDWLSLGTIEEVEAAMNHFEKYDNMSEHVEIMRVYIDRNKD